MESRSCIVESVSGLDQKGQVENQKCKVEAKLWFQLRTFGLEVLAQSVFNFALLVFNFALLVFNFALLILTSHRHTCF